MNMEQQVFSPDTTAIAACGNMPDKLGKALAIGMVRGLVGIVANGDTSVTAAESCLAGLARELIRQDILVLVAGGVAGAMDQAGLLRPSGAELAGSGLAEFCDHLGIPPVLHVDSNLDGAQILALFSTLAEALGVEIADLPAATSLPENMESQDAAAIGQCRAELVHAGLETVFGGGLLTKADPGEAAGVIGARITAKRLALGFNDRFDGSVYS